MTYLDWLDKHHLHKWEISPRTAFDAGYEEGQEAERERIKQIITYYFGELVSDLSEIMEMIDDA